MATEVKSSTPLVLVTGATGFIAGHLIQQLLERNYKVRGTVRSMADIESFYYLHRLRNAVNLEIVEADLVDSGSWAKAFEGDVQYVLHVASPYILRPSDPEAALMIPAVTGTKHILEMCQANKSVKKLVFTSCACALSDEFEPEKDYDENDWNETSSLERNSYAFRYCLFMDLAAFYTYYGDLITLSKLP
jgi:dihydroflavonol-4-reductase